MPDEIAKRGRPSTFSQEIADEICRHLADGKTLREISRMPDMPPASTVRSWALEDREGFFAQYSRARELGYLEMAEEVLEIADDGSNDWMLRRAADGTLEEAINHEHVNRSRLRLDTRKWLLSKALPKIYGDKLAHTGPDGGPIQTQEVGDKELARRLALVLARGAHAKPEDDSGSEPQG